MSTDTHRLAALFAALALFNVLAWVVFVDSDSRASESIEPPPALTDRFSQSPRPSASDDAHEVVAHGAEHAAQIVGARLGGDEALGVDRVIVHLRSDSGAAPPDFVRSLALDGPEERRGLRIEPQIAGRWLADGDGGLAFHFDAPPEPATTITVSGRTESTSGRATVTVPRPEFVRATLVSTEAERVEIELSFDIAAPASWLRRITSLSGGADASPMEWLTEGTASVHRVRTTRPSGDRLHIRIDRGDGRSSEATIFPPQRFALLGADDPQIVRDEAATVSLHFGQLLATPVPTDAIRVEPAVDGLTITAQHRRIALRGLFLPGVTYRISVPGALRSATGETLVPAGDDAPAHIVATVTARAPRPSLRLPDGDGILAPDGLRRLTIESVDVPEVTVRAIRIHDDLLVPMLRGLRPLDAGRIVRTQRITLDGAPHARHRTTLDLSSLIGDSRGVFVIEIHDERSYWRRAQATVAVTDLAPVVRIDNDGALVWATGVRDAQPRDGAVVTAHGRAGRILAEARSDADGLARLAFRANHPDGPLTAVVVRDGDDLALVQTERGGTPPAGVDGFGRPDPDGLDLLLFAERGVHRPGEPLHITGLLRSGASNETVPPDMPILLSLIDPSERTIVERTATARRADQGFLGVELPTSSAGATGTHRLVARIPGSNRPLATLEVPIEPFVPATTTGSIEAMTESTSGTGASDGPTEVRFTVVAERIGGGPVSGARVAARGWVAPARPQPDGWATHLFGIAPDSAPRPFNVAAEPTDGDGRSVVVIPVPTAGVFVGRVTITEPAGRSITISAPQRHVGLGVHGATILGARLGEFDAQDVASSAATPTAAPVVDADLPIALSTVLVATADDSATAAAYEQAGQISVTIARVEHDWTYEFVAGDVVWRCDEHTAIVREFTLPAGAHGVAHGSTLDPLPAGHYRLTLHHAPTDARCEFDFHARGLDESGTPERPDRVELIADATPIVPGTETTILVRSPFAGRALFTIESQRVQTTLVRDVPEGATTVIVPLPASLRASATLTAVVVRGVDPAAPSWRAHRATGAVRLPVDISAQRLSVTLDAETRVAPGATVTVRGRVDLTDDDSATPVVRIWAVDEGVLQAAAWSTPDPVAHFHGALRHGVRHFDARSTLLPDHAGLLATDSIGGDIFLASLGRRLAGSDPIDAPQAIVIAPALVPTDANGDFVWSFDMPAVDGALRIMAVAAAVDRYGHAEHLVTPDRAMRLAVTMPRAVAPGDLVRSVIRAVNERDTPLHGRVLVDNVEIAHGIEFAPGTEVRIALPLPAADRTTTSLAAHIKVIDDDGTPISERVVSTPVRAVSPRMLAISRVRLVPGDSIEIDAPSGFDPDDLVRRIVASRGLGAELDRLIEFVIDYPYGCAEQTTSRLRGLLAVASLGSAHRARVAPMIESGLHRLRDLQTEDGGLAYWPGGREADTASTLLAATLVADAEAQGFAAPTSLRRGLVASLDRTVRQEGVAATDGTRALALDALVTLDGPRPAWVEVMAHNVDAIARSGGTESLVALATAALGSDMEPTALRIVQALERVEPTSDGGPVGHRFGSPITAAARTLRLLSTLDIAVDRRDLLEEQLLEHAAQDQVTTADAAAIIEALSTSMAAAAPDGPTTTSAARLLVDDSELVADDGGPLLRAELRADARVVLTAPTDGPALRIVVTHDGRGVGDGVGAPAGAVASGLRLQRRWIDGDGQPIALEMSDSATVVRAGDLIHVELTIATGDRATVRDVVIADLLPGGFEIEHPGLARTSPDGGVILENATRAEIRDDRMIVFLDAGEPATIRYAIRAVVPGSYTLPPTTAEAMYEPRRRAVTGGGRLEIVP